MSYYLKLPECIEGDTHLTACDDDGYCNACGEQDDINVDDNKNCVYCGQKCYDGELCDEQQAGGFGCSHCDSRNTAPLDDEFECYDCGKTFKNLKRRIV